MAGLVLESMWTDLLTASLLLSLLSSLQTSLLPKPGDQAPTAASAEAAEGGEEAAEKRCRHSESRGNESKGKCCKQPQSSTRTCLLRNEDVTLLVGLQRCVGLHLPPSSD